LFLRISPTALILRQVIWLNWGLTDEDMKTMPAGVQRGFLRSILHPESSSLRSYAGLGADLGDSKGRCLFAGYWNTELYAPLKSQLKPNDIHCAKNRLSGLWNPDQPLWKALHAEKNDTILFAGVNTDQCVQGTLVDAYNLGWNCILIDDCCGTTTVGAKEVVFHNMVVSISPDDKCAHC
jgi:phosphatidylethanolamine-binding protein